MRKHIFSNLALAVVLTLWVVLTPAHVMATPSGIVHLTVRFALRDLSVRLSINYDGSAGQVWLVLQPVTF